MGSPKLVDVTMKIAYERRRRTVEQVTIVHNVPEADAQACKKAWQRGRGSFRLESIDRTEGGLYNLGPVTDISF